MATFSVSVRGIELGVCQEEIERHFKKVALPAPPCLEAQRPHALEAESETLAARCSPFSRRAMAPSASGPYEGGGGGCEACIRVLCVQYRGPLFCPQYASGRAAPSSC